jgi:hypothetical protein
MHPHLALAKQQLKALQQSSTTHPHLFQHSHSLLPVRQHLALVKQQLKTVQQSSAVRHRLALVE